MKWCSSLIQQVQKFHSKVPFISTRQMQFLFTINNILVLKNKSKTSKTIILEICFAASGGWIDRSKLEKRNMKAVRSECAHNCAANSNIAKAIFENPF